MEYDMIDRFLRNNLGDDDYAEYSAALDSLCTSQPKKSEPVAAAKKDEVFAASIEFIGTLTGMTPPPIEVAPPEVFKPFRDFTEKVCSIFAIPSQSKPLTDEELDLILQRSPIQANYGDLVALSRDIEAAHNIKDMPAQPAGEHHGNAEDLYVAMSKHLNCPHCGGSGHVDDVAQPEQEPVAHFGSAYVNENGVHITTVLGPVAIPQDAKLYTTPPQRTWVGLTDEDFKNCTYGGATDARRWEAVLKEKNT